MLKALSRNRFVIFSILSERLENSGISFCWASNVSRACDVTSSLMRFIKSSNLSDDTRILDAWLSRLFEGHGASSALSVLVSIQYFIFLMPMGDMVWA